MEVPFSEVHHLEIFILEDEKFIKDARYPAMGNATRWPSKKNRGYIFLPPETLVRRKEPDKPRN